MSYIRKITVAVFLFIGIMMPCAIGSAALQTGDAGDMVYELQERLASLHYDVSADGAFGPNTEKAVRKFQQDSGLEVDGRVGNGTWDMLTRMSPTPSRASRPIGDRVVAIAKQYISTPYAYGGTGPGGFDCSGFTQYVFRQAGVNLYRAADAQYIQGRYVDESMLSAGDLLFFSTYEAGPSHVGIYVGNSRFIHSGTSTGVTISYMYDSYWGPRYIGAKRILR